MMNDPDHNQLLIRRQCDLVSIWQGLSYRSSAGESTENLDLMRIIDKAIMEMP
jgi:hypothetical protein